MSKRSRIHTIAILLAAFIGSMSATAFAQWVNPTYYRPVDQTGANLFEDPFVDETPYEGLGIELGGAFAQQFQGLSHENAAQPVMKDGKNSNQLIEIGNGFNLATANLNLDATLAEGVRVNLVTYLSSRHHQEAWVKGGYLQIDEAPFLGSELINNIFEHVRLRLGHFEVNYGDSHFRRTDNGNGIWNPFIGNYLEDPFTTEIGGEVYVYDGPLFAMGALTGGEIKGDITKPEGRSQSVYGKIGYDSQISEDLRLRLTGSVYHNGNAASNTLFAGDRAGSRYYFVLEPTTATTNGNFRSGLMNPNFTEKVTAMQINPFVKYRGLELFGVIDMANGRTAAETDDRNCKLYSVEGLYRFQDREQVYVGGRYQISKGEMVGTRDEVEMQRIQVGAGWYPTKNILLKAEYVTQTYVGFPVTNILHEGKFNGLMIEGAVAF